MLFLSFPRIIELSQQDKKPYEPVKSDDKMVYWDLVGLHYFDSVIA